MRKSILSLIFYILIYNLTYGQNISNDSIYIENEDLKWLHFKYKNFTNINEKSNEQLFTKDTIIIDTLCGEPITIKYKCSNGIITQIKGQYKNGHLFGLVNYKEGVKDGSETFWYRNFVIHCCSVWENGVQITPYNCFYKSGILAVIDYRDNIVCNERFVIAYYPNGKIYLNERMLDCNRQLISLKYWVNGNILRIDSANMGKRLYVSYYDNGGIAMKGFKYDAIWYRLGKWENWHENGIKSREYYYNESTPNEEAGTWLWWNEKGKLTRKEVYENGKLIEQHSYTKQKNEEIFFEKVN